MADGAIGGSPVRNLTSPPVMASIEVVSFFCGCGGLDLGFQGGFEFLGKHYKKNRFQIKAAYDADSSAIRAYRENVGAHASVVDLAEVDMSSLPHADVLLGGFPCQEFSQCGPRGGTRSARGGLYRRMVEYASVHQPKVVVGENVAGLLYRDGGLALQTIQDDFARVGYTSHVWEVRAQYHGVPQARHRLFLIFVRNDISSVSIKAPVPSERAATARDAIADLLLPRNRKVPNQSQYFKAARAARGHGQGDERTPLDGPAYTIRANSRSRVQFHYSRPRRLTVRECARLQSFPDNFIFPFAATANMKLIGNAVPPVLAHAVAQSVEQFVELANLSKSGVV
jgi:DNA (cytosine-5)-methyltransferase 1